MSWKLLVVLLVVAMGGSSAFGESRGSGGLPSALPAKLVADYGARAMTPGFIPSGYTYLQWKNTDDHSSQISTFGNLTIIYGYAGSLLQWTVDTPASSYDCKHPYADETRRIGQFVVSFASGNHGQEAWTCVGSGPTGFEINAWDPHILTASTLMSVVASARRARASSPSADSTPRVGVPAIYVGPFGSVDGRERCVAANDAVRCVSAISGQTIQLTAYRGTFYLGKGAYHAERGPRMPEGTKFTTPDGHISCSSGTFGIECHDNETSGFVIGDHYVRVIETDVNRRIAG